MTTIPMALIGVDHPHALDWYSTLLAVPELVPVAHYDPDPAKAQELLRPPFDQLPVYGDLAELLAGQQIQAALQGTAVLSDHLQTDLDSSVTPLPVHKPATDPLG